MSKSVRVAIAVVIVGALMAALFIPFKRPIQLRIVLPPVAHQGH